MEIINNYIDSFLFHLNDVIASMDKMLGLKFHYKDGWDFLLNNIVWLILVYLFGKSNILEWIHEHDSDAKYTGYFVITMSLGLIYLLNGVDGLLVLFFVGVVLIFFDYVVLSNKKYRWLKEFLMKLF